MLSFNVIREDQSTVSEVDEFEFFGGEDVTLKLQIISSYDDKPYQLPAAATVQITVPNNTSTPTQKAASIDSTDRSIITVAFTDTETSAMISGYIRVTITLSGGDIRIAKRDNIIKKNDLS